VLCNICAALSDYKKRKRKKQRCKKNTEVKKKPHQTKKSERKEEKKKSKIQKCLHPLYRFAELFGCLLELGPGQV